MGHIGCKEGKFSEGSTRMPTMEGESGLVTIPGMKISLLSQNLHYKN